MEQPLSHYSRIISALEKNQPPAFLDALLIVGIVCFGAWLRLYNITNIDIPDFQPDEFRIAMGAAAMIHNKVPILGYESAHEPPLSLYFPIPFFLLFGWDLWVIKLVSIFYSLAAIVFIYLFGREYFSWRAGAVAALMTAALPFAVRFGRIMVEHSFLPFLMACALYGFAGHLRTGRAGRLCFSAFFLGLGISTKIVCLFFIPAFLLALMISGEFRRIRLEKKQYKILAAWFLAGAAPFLLFAGLSINFLPILFSAAQGGGVGRGAEYFVNALYIRLITLGKNFTPAVLLAPLAWAIGMLWKKSPCDSRPVFLFTLCATVTLQSTVTISGLHDEQIFALLPALAVLAASMVDIPFRRFPGLSVELTGAALVLIILSFLNSACVGCYATWPLVSRMSAPLHEMDVRRTIPTTRDVTMAHRYVDFIKTGNIPDYRVPGVVSPGCNRFKRCGPAANVLDLLTYPNLIDMYKGALKESENRAPDDFELRAPDFSYTSGRLKTLRKMLAWLFMEKNFKYLLIEITPPGEELYPGFSESTLNIMTELKNEGILSWEKMEYVEDGRGFIALDVDVGHY